MQECCGSFARLHHRIPFRQEIIDYPLLVHIKITPAGFESWQVHFYGDLWSQTVFTLQYIFIIVITIIIIVVILFIYLFIYVFIYSFIFIPSRMDVYM